MRNKLYWGLGVLAVLLIGVALGLLIRPTNKVPITIYRGDIEPSKEDVDPMRHKISKQKPTARLGYKIVPHGDHYHEVKIEGTEDTTPAVKLVAPVPKTNSEGLTYHAELLETNPVKALRLMAEELGHWSKNHIPPFPPDDLEAQEFARNIYLSIYLDETHPDRKKVGQAFLDNLDTIREYPYGARKMDLRRLSWIKTSMSEDEVYRHPGFHPSDYFKHQNPYFKAFVQRLQKEGKLRDLFTDEYIEQLEKEGMLE